MNKIRRKPKLQKALDMIEEMFQELLTRPAEEHKHWIDALDFHNRARELDISLPTLHQARNVYQIETEKIGNHWRWLLPKRTQAEEEIINDDSGRLGKMMGVGKIKQFRIKRQKYLDEQLSHLGKEAKDQLIQGEKQYLESVVMLAEEMRHFNYDVPAETLLEAYKKNGSRGFSRMTAFRAKKILNIRSVRAPDGWRWVYAPAEVQDWLISQLGRKFVPVETLLEKALDEHNWSARVVHQARRMLGGIKFTHQKNQLCWYDMNFTGPRRKRTEEEEGVDRG